MLEILLMGSRIATETAPGLGSVSYLLYQRGFGHVFFWFEVELVRELTVLVEEHVELLLFDLVSFFSAFCRFFVLLCTSGTHGEDY